MAERSIVFANIGIGTIRRRTRSRSAAVAAPVFAYGFVCTRAIGTAGSGYATAAGPIITVRFIGTCRDRTTSRGSSFYPTCRFRGFAETRIVLTYHRIGTFQYGASRPGTAVARPVVTYRFIGTGGVGAYRGRDTVAGPILTNRFISTRFAVAGIPIHTRQRTLRPASRAIEIGITVTSTGVLKIYTVRRSRFSIANLRAVLRSVIRTVLRIRLACRRYWNFRTRKPILALTKPVTSLLTGSRLAAASSAELDRLGNFIIFRSRTSTGPLAGYILPF